MMEMTSDLRQQVEGDEQGGLGFSGHAAHYSLMFTHQISGTDTERIIWAQA